METAEDEWWVRMELAETIDYSVRESVPGASNPELMDTTSASIPSELLASPTFPEKQSNLSDEEHCARITTVIKKKDLAQNLYDAYAAALTGYSIDDDDLKQLKKRHDDLQLAMRENSENSKNSCSTNSGKGRRRWGKRLRGHIGHAQSNG
ncbi:hypothetical protein CDAR_578381 [Caerostris darwini]|uniref:Uncharacterized protein n=1 Tax=Caerostris darwini TaxID=1538125 RepID=A0AAV4QHE3_9ARAC|nr:hypothetical protein CDAR_578251 [Caerostris darwini]GIY06753.1 hypothetical protein CDAR_578381 [Caerostris darwini]